MELYIGKFHSHKYLSGCQEGCPFLISDLHVLDATTGQNALAQAKEFNEVTDITGIVLTKMDGTANLSVQIMLQR